MSLATYNHITKCTDCHCVIEYTTISPIDTHRRMVCFECEILNESEECNAVYHRDFPFMCTKGKNHAGQHADSFSDYPATLVWD